MSHELTKDEQHQLEKHEQVIERHMKDFVAVGAALQAIRDSRLYAATHATFESYCAERWDFTHRYANRLIAATEVLKSVEFGNSDTQTHPKLTQIIDSENKATELGKVAPEKRAEVVETLAAMGKKTTAADVRVVAASVESNERAKPKSKPKPSNELLPNVQEAFDHRYEFDAIIDDLNQIVGKVKILAKKRWGVFITPDIVASLVENVKTQISFAKPWADCVPCQQKGCKRCRNSGWTGRDVFNALTDDLKALSRIKGKK